MIKLCVYVTLKLVLAIFSQIFIFHQIIAPQKLCPFESGNCRNERKKLQKLEYLKNEKSFLDEIKSIFHSF